MTINPVLGREVKERFRRRWTPLFVTLWLATVAAVGYLSYLVGRGWLGSFLGPGLGTVAAVGLGRFMFESLALVLLTAVLFVVPGIAALAIVGERERLTLPLLQVTQLRPGQIVRGKLLASLAYMTLLVAAVAPLLVLPILLGGVTVADATAALVVIAATALVVGAASLWISARARSVRGAVAAAYLVPFFLAVVTLLALAGEIVLFRAAPNDTFGPTGRELYAAWPNPYVALVSAVDEPIRSRGAGLPTPFQAIDELLIRRQGGRQGVNFRDALFFAFGVEGPDEELAVNRGFLWHRSLLLYGIVTVVALVAATRHVTVPRRGRRVKEPADAT